MVVAEFRNVEGRYANLLYNLEQIRDREQWEELKVIGLCYSERSVGPKRGEELRLFIGSRRAGAKTYGEALRDHWGIENNLHWQLDVTFGEDRSRVQERTNAQNLALLRKWALNLLGRAPGDDSIKVKRYKAALNTAFLEQVLNGR